MRKLNRKKFITLLAVEISPPKMEVFIHRSIIMKRWGFSHWELLALGAVSCTLGTLLVPVVAKTSAKARPNEDQRAQICVNNLKLIGLGLLQYQQDYDERMPLASFKDARATSSPSVGWANVLQPYIRNTSVYQCPSDSRVGQRQPTRQGYTDYWLNKNLSGRNVILARSPMLLLMVGEGEGASRDSSARYSLNKLPKRWLKSAKSPARRHLGQGTYAFADGHIERLKPTEVGTRAATFLLR
jgi:prepilin-type processing-associated H-X9-DG protein